MKPSTLLALSLAWVCAVAIGTICLVRPARAQDGTAPTAPKPISLTSDAGVALAPVEIRNKTAVFPAGVDKGVVITENKGPILEFTQIERAGTSGVKFSRVSIDSREILGFTSYSASFLAPKIDAGDIVDQFAGHKCCVVYYGHCSIPEQAVVLGDVDVLTTAWGLTAGRTVVRLTWEEK